MRSKLVVGNWKLNGSMDGNDALLKSLLREIPPGGSAGCAVCAPYPYLAQLQGMLRGSGIAWGGQDVSQFDQGAYTGEVSGRMLAEFGCRYAIVGHSERRALFGDTDAVAADKYAAARRAGLTPIFCVGETLEEREGEHTEAVLARQLDALLEKQGAAGLEGGLFGPGGASNFLSGTRAVLAAVFFATSLGLTYFSMPTKSGGVTQSLESPASKAADEKKIDVKPAAPAPSAPAPSEKSSEIPK